MGSIVSITGDGNDEYIKPARIGKARKASISLKSVWRSTELSIKIRSGFSTPMGSQCYYTDRRHGASRKGTLNKLHNFINSCLRSILLKIRWPARKDQKQRSTGGKRWSQVKTLAENRTQWRRETEALYSSRTKENNNNNNDVSSMLCLLSCTDTLVQGYTSFDYLI
uniref:Uncharacterized protein n=1 Tax=Trichobilharzia regenti TaxID=157069 RepID=A0AA85JEY7_TRIRE|nr:unnamed protein product [Trichobilharzia regenti]CAH8820809.1 unnamed protein product [Trichobilharzia regenti]